MLIVNVERNKWHLSPVGWFALGNMVKLATGSRSEALPVVYRLIHVMVSAAASYAAETQAVISACNV
jgi:hypothetical protein